MITYHMLRTISMFIIYLKEFMASDWETAVCEFVMSNE